MRLRTCLAGVLLGLSLFSVNAAAADLSTGGSPAFSSSSVDMGSLGEDGSSSQAKRAAAHHLYLPTKTPTPLEGYRWPGRHIKIYLDTQDHSLRTAFRDAVKQWNKTGAVKIKWTSSEEKADIIATSGDLSSSQPSTNVGYVSSQLGSTSTEYNPDTNALINATSTLDGNQLDYTSRRFQCQVAEHELGHALGLAHAPEYSHSVMIPRNIRTGITKADRQTVRQLYNVEK